MSRWEKEGRKNPALKLNGLADIKASGPWTPRQWTHRLKVSPLTVAYSGVDGKVKIP